MVLRSPAYEGEIAHDPRSLRTFGRIPPPLGPSRVGAVENEMGHPVRMPCRILDGDRAAPARSHHGKMLEGGGIHHAFKITHPVLAGKIANISIGEAAAARIVAQYLMLAGERVEPGAATPDCAIDAQDARARSRTLLAAAPHQ